MAEQPGKNRVKRQFEADETGRLWKNEGAATVLPIVMSVRCLVDSYTFTNPSRISDSIESLQTLLFRSADTLRAGLQNPLVEAAERARRIH